MEIEHVQHPENLNLSQHSDTTQNVQLSEGVGNLRSQKLMFIWKAQQQPWLSLEPHMSY